VNRGGIAFWRVLQKENMKMKKKENLCQWFWRLTMNSGCVELSAAATLSVFLGLVCFAFCFYGAVAEFC
jgi:hypothetical protein